MVPQTQTISNQTALSGSHTEHWFAIRKNHSYIAVSISIDGTAELVIEGRNTPLDTAVVLTTVSATDAQLIQHMNELRVRYVSASGSPNCVVSLDTPALDTGA
jgi:hypothetical protein